MMAKATCLVGLDVHARQTHAALLDSRTGEINVRRLIGMPEAAVLPYLEHLGDGVLAAYEAGPTGFGLAREAKKREARCAGGGTGIDPQGRGRPGEDRPPRRCAAGQAAGRGRAAVRVRSHR
jgi:transposase